jgi:uncharacterized protein (DUF1499 family)
MRFAGNGKDAQQRLLNILNRFERVRIVRCDHNFIQAEFVSAIFGFVDDVEFYFDYDQKLIHLKSASRIGFSDFGTNRRRIETIRKQYNRK